MFEVIEKVAAAMTRLQRGARLRPYEQACLDAWRAALPEDDRRTLDAQLGAIRHTLHPAGGTQVRFYYRAGDGTPRFRESGPALHAATVLLHAGGDAGLSLPAQIHLKRGRFSSIEFPEPPERHARERGARPVDWRAVMMHRQPG